jgi:hypothetical protein
MNFAIMHYIVVTGKSFKVSGLRSLRELYQSLYASIGLNSVRVHSFSTAEKKRPKVQKRGVANVKKNKYVHFYGQLGSTGRIGLG